MKQFGLGRRLMSLLLALAMIVAMIPAIQPTKANAAVGDVFDVGTGLTGNIDTSDTISWPIKIYDYLNDGMLFEYSAATDTNVTAHGGASYGGGEKMPMIDYAIPGNDYTSVQGYYNYLYTSNKGYYYEQNSAIKNWGNRSLTARYDGNVSEVDRSINQPVDDVSPMSLHLKYVGDSNDGKAYGWITDFANDGGTSTIGKYRSKEDIRYMVIVYKTNAAYALGNDGKGHQLRPYWAVAKNARPSSGTVDITSVHSSLGWKYNDKHTGTLVGKQVYLQPSTDTWTYQIIDMKTNLQESQYPDDQPMSSNNYGIKDNWDKIGANRIAGVGISYPLAAPGEEMDISHIAYFGSEIEAQRFGEAGVKFDNNPGKYVGYELYYAYEVSNTSNVPTKPSDARDYLDFTKYDAGGWDNKTIDAWSSTHGLNIDGGVHQGKSYMTVTDNDSNADTAYVWNSTSNYTASGLSGYTSLRYVTIIYRTKGITNPQIGFWLEDTADPEKYQAGKYVNTSVDLPASEGEWKAFTYDLRSIQDTFGQSFKGKVEYYNRIGMKFPELSNSSQKLEIAYIVYTGSNPSSFKTAAVNYMNTRSGNDIRNTMFKSSSPILKNMWNMGSNQGYTFLYPSTGGGWTKSDGVAGGGNTTSNGYHSYALGYCYAGFSAKDQFNSDRAKAATLGMDYRVSNTIFLMQATSSTGNIDLSKLGMGYTLYNKVKSGVMTAGLLQSSQATYTGVDGKDYKVMQYKDDTIHYLATLLRDTLTIPEYNFEGFNYTFVKGSESPLYSEDYDGDGKLDKNEDADDDGNLDIFEDLNKNGELDAGEDLDHDGHLDIFEDTNRNGKLDIAEDIDNDGNIDQFEDLDFDGKLGTHEDIDGDGRLDLIEDNNHNGVLDEGEDRNGNGKLDLTEDVNGNKKLDASEDKDGDGRLDLIEDKNSNGKMDEGEDLNGNGKLDLTEDVDGNGILNPNEDRDGDGKLDLVNEDTDGDGFLDIEEDLNGNGVLDKCDLATALRGRLGITFNYNKIMDSTSKSYKGTYTAKLGSYADTMNKVLVKDGDKTVNKLIGPYLQCASNINTFYDAAYYLLHNLFVADSYNQPQNDYNYLVMSKAVVAGEGKEAYVFDAGFTAPDESTGIVYNRNNKTISLSTALNKHHMYYLGTLHNTLYPFTPINDKNDAPDDPFGFHGTPYFRDDGAVDYKGLGGSYAGRNYNYVMQANGEFVYHYDDDLFFDFEGDDDVYMFVNGELVLDIGAAHSITVVGFKMNDYVAAAQQKMKELSAYGYDPEMTDEELDALLAKVSGLDADEKADYKRMHRLNLIDGKSYPIDFYYMERHGTGANMRIATNIVMTDPTLVTDKNAYQGTDANGNPIKVDYGALIDASQSVGYEFSVTNNGNTKLYDISFSDPDIGLTLTPDAGLQTFSKATVGRFTVEEDTIISFKGLDGVVNLDGKVYHVTSDGWITWEENGNTLRQQGISITYDPVVSGNNLHELRMYQFNTQALFQDVTASVIFDGAKEVFTPVTDTKGVFGLQPGKNNKVVVQGIRVTNAQGNLLTPADLTFTIQGYASYKDFKAGKKTEPITVKVENNDQLMAFLQNLDDPKDQTGSGEIIPDGQSSLYWGAGLWQYSTVTVSGMHYALSATEQKAKVFNNTVYTTAYKSPDSEEVLKGQDQHRVYTPGEPMYFQWAGHDVYLTLDRLWGDVEKNAMEESNMLYVQSQGIGALSRGEDVNGNGKLDLQYPEDKDGDGKLDAGEDVNGNNKLDRTEDVDGDGRLDVGEDKNANGRLDPGEDVDGDGNMDIAEDLNDNGKLDAYEDANGNGKLDTGVDTLELFICDKNGNELTSSDNMYAGGLWTTYDKAANEDTADERTIYFQNNDRWGKVYIYYWSDENSSMVAWPGDEMTMVEDALYDVYAAKIPGDAQYVIFSNGSIQTDDLTLPSVDYNKVTWDEENRKLDVAYDHTGMHLFYLQVSSNVSGLMASVRIPVTFYVTNVKDHTVVVDYGLQTEDLNAVGRLFKGDELLGGHKGTKVSFMGVATTQPTYLNEFTPDGKKMNRMEFPEAEKQEVDVETGVWKISVEDGKFCFTDSIDPAGLDLKYAGNSYTMSKRFWFQPTDFMDAEYDLWLNINVHQADAVHSSVAEATDKMVYHTSNEIDIGTEVQMYKKITVLPATVVYYEDDFSGINYYEDKGEFTKIGEGSGNLTQGLEQNTNYGWETVYQEDTSDEISGNSLMSIKLSNPDALASFNFKGTGFELIGRTNAFDSATFVVKVKDSNGTVIRNMPVITEFTSTTKGCVHPYHNTNGYCSHCGVLVAGLHKYTDGYCTICGVAKSERIFYLCGDGVNGNYLSGGDKFVDGKLTMTLGEDHYVYVKDSEGNVYHTYKYPGDHATSTTMYAGLTGPDADKLRVIGGAEVTFTLVDNGNGSIALSYTTDIQQGGERTIYFDNTATQWEKVLIYYWSDGNDRMVDWPGVEMERMGDTEIYKYVVPYDAQEVLFNNGSAGLGNQTPDFLIPGDGFIYANGAWSVFGEESFITLYFKNTYVNAEPYAYAWSHIAGTNTEYLNGWPGTKMTPVEGMPGYYSILVSANAKQVIFNNGDRGQQTSDLTIDASKPLFINNKWSVYPLVMDDRPVYFKNSEGWNDVYATFRENDGEPTTVKMVEVREGFFACEVPLDTNYIYFDNGVEKPADYMLLLPNENLYDNGKWGIYTSDEGKQIHQVPTIRINNLPYGDYTVEIQGVPTYNFPDDFDFVGHFKDGKLELSPEEIELYTYDTYLYLDGVRVYQPLGEPNDNYSAHENGAKFYELRNLILDGKAVVATYDVSTTFYTGNFSWSENRNDNLPGGTAYVGNQLSGINDYMLVGPNNEVYMNGSLKKEAIIFYVSEDLAASTHNLQVGVRGIDSGLFMSGVSTGVDATLYQSTQVFNPTTGEDSYGWSVVTTIQSGTEQYYTIDYSKCPKVNGMYQVALYVRNGMVSFTSLKLNGLKIASAGISVDTCYSYDANGMLLPNHDWDQAEITKLPTCKTTGSAVRSCLKCGTREFVTLPKTHNCTNGICGTCGKRIVYAKAAADYGVPSLYSWNNSGALSGTFPGTSMNVVEGEENMYMLEIDAAAEKVIFSNNSQQSDDLLLPTDGNYYYDIATGKWIKMDELEACSHKKHDVDGKCVKCGAAVEHVYVDGKCSCGLFEEIEDDSLITIYFDNSGYNWSEIRVHAWNGFGNCTGEWPGVSMEHVEGTIYSVQISKDAQKIIFNNNNGSKTDDLIIPQDGKNQFNSATQTWSVYGEAPCQHLTHGQDGKCTDCGVEVEHTYVDGKCSCGLDEPSAEDAVTLYVKPNANWRDGGARFAALLATEDWSTQTWIDAIDSNGDGVYEVTLPQDGKAYALIIFCRMNPDTTENNWNNKWNQTLDLNIPTDGTDCYIVAENTWDQGGGEWIVYGGEGACPHATHTQDGKCTDCGIAVEHVYVDGKCSCGLTESEPVQSAILYLVPNTNWHEGNARFAAVLATEGWSAQTWVDAIDSDGDGVYEVNVPQDGNTYVIAIFCRMNPGTTENNWDNRWNQTSNLNIPTDGADCYIVAEDTWDYGGGEWVTYVTSNSLLSLYAMDQQMQTLAGFADNELPGDDGFHIENEIVERPDLKLEYPTISLEDEVTMQVYFSTDAEISAENVGILAWDAAPSMLNKKDGIQGGILAENGLYCVSLPVSAEKLGDEIYLCVYAELADGTVVYSDVVTYSVKSYAYSKLANSNTDNELKALLVSLLNYGAAAQVYFDYKTDALVNADLTAEQQTLAESYNANMVKPVAQPTGSKVSAFAANGGFADRSASAHFESAFGISYLMTGSVEATGDQAMLYFWTQEQFDALETLSAENCTGSVTMTLENGTFIGFVGGIAAKDINDTVYAATVYTGNDGVTYSTGVLAYSLGAYCANMVNKGSEDMRDLAAATIVYGFYASAYFGN